MEWTAFVIDLVLHIDKHLASFVAQHGMLIYPLLFAIIFVETGVVVMPFLPGDSLLFVVGTLCGLGLLSLPLCIGLLLAAAVLGDQLNFTIGARIGPKVFQWEQSRWFNRRAFDRAHAFYGRYGGITIVAARFMPFIRTFAPFVAGVAAMPRLSFALYNALGAALWVIGLTLAGYAFGEIPWVQSNLQRIIWAMLIIPGVLVGYGAWRSRGEGRATA